MLSQQEGCVCKSLKADKSRSVGNMKKLSIAVASAIHKEKQFMYEKFFPSAFTFRDNKH